MLLCNNPLKEQKEKLLFSQNDFSFEWQFCCSERRKLWLSFNRQNCETQKKLECLLPDAGSGVQKSTRQMTLVQNVFGGGTRFQKYLVECSKL